MSTNGSSTEASVGSDWNKALSDAVDEMYRRYRHGSAPAEKPSRTAVDADLLSCPPNRLRANPAEVLEWVTLQGKGVKIEITTEFKWTGPDTRKPVAAILPWDQYAELVAIRDQVRDLAAKHAPAPKEATKT